MGRISFEEARALVLNNIRVLKSEVKSPLAALGQVSAETVEAKIYVPDWDASALDGFALRSLDIGTAKADSPVFLKVVGRITAGQTVALKVNKGVAVRIMTGAPIPEGADCVVGFEDSQEPSDGSARIGILKSASVGGNIKRAGEQVRKGSMVLQKGQILGPAEVGLLDSLGLADVKVVRRPQVAIVATGEELLLPGQPLEPAKIYCGNAGALAAQAIRYGGTAKILKIARDNLSALRQQIRQAAKLDIIVTIGGSSLGDRDLVKEIMAEMGKVVFSQVEMTPGKSTAFGLIKSEREKRTVQVPHFALSGNPTAAMITFEALVRPAILKMRGLDEELQTDMAQAIREFSNPGAKTRLVWVTVRSQDGVFVAAPAEGDGQGMLPSIAAANGIAIIPPELKKVAMGQTIQVMPLEWR